MDRPILDDPLLDPTFGEVVPRHEITGESHFVICALFACSVILINKFPSENRVLIWKQAILKYCLSIY